MRGLSSALVLLAALAIPAAAAAESPQHFAFEAKFGPYVPALDQTEILNGRTPFSDMFGDPADPKGAPPSRGLLSLGEFDYQFFHRFGVLGIGFSAGYYRKSAPGFQNTAQTGHAPDYCTLVDNGSGGRRYTVRDPMQTADKPLPRVDVGDVSRCFSSDENIFNLVPLSLLAVYRFDVLDKRFRIPLIPYIKLGLGYYIWWFGNSAHFVSTADSTVNDKPESFTASGATVGFILNPGLALDLSALDPSAARAIDQEIGLNRVTLFVEMHGAWVKGCGCTKAVKLDLSDLTFTAGIGFEF